MTEFEAFPKIHRLYRPVVITEKIDGTNAAIGVQPLGLDGADGHAAVNVDDDHNFIVYAQSRKRIISPDGDNFGFAAWVREHAYELAVGLGEGLHFGEWWGRGIQRTYGLDERRFSLFNTARWGDEEEMNGFGEIVKVTQRPACCHVVPVLAELDRLDTVQVNTALYALRDSGSSAAPGFRDPEGLVVYHTQANKLFKVTMHNDEKGKEQ